MEIKEMIKQVMCVGLAWLGLAVSASAQTTIVEYVHTDALGSPVAVTDASGAVIQSQSQVYEPYGAPISHGPTDGPGFTGHVEDSATGLTYMQQRYYDPQLARFLSTDPVTAPKSPRAFNRFSYAINNPYKFTDPDGRAALITQNKDGSVDVKIPVKFVGGSADDVAKIKEGVSNYFSGNYNIKGKDTQVRVSVVDVTDQTPKRLTNTIKLVDGPTSDVKSQGASFVTANTKGGEWNRNNLNGSSLVIQHEAGHLMGMEDHYKAWFDETGQRRSKPESGYEGNIMGEVRPTATPNGGNFEEAMRGSKNVYAKEE